jgi:hypothetical protein
LPLMYENEEGTVAVLTLFLNGILSGRERPAKVDRGGHRRCFIDSGFQLRGNRGRGIVLCGVERRSYACLLQVEAVSQTNGWRAVIVSFESLRCAGYRS